MALVRMLPSVFVFFMVMGLIMLGIATPTEAAATGVLGAIVLAAYYRGLSFKMLADALFSAATVASLLLIIMCVGRDVQPVAHLHGRRRRRWASSCPARTSPAGSCCSA